MMIKEEVNSKSSVDHWPHLYHLEKYFHLKFGVRWAWVENLALKHIFLETLGKFLSISASPTNLKIGEKLGRCLSSTRRLPSA